MAQYVEGPYIVEDQPDGTRKVVGYSGQQATPQSNTLITKQANPVEQQGDVLKNQLTQVQIQKAIDELQKGDKPNLPTGYRMRADGTAELIPGVAAPGTGNKATAAQRTDAIQGFNDAAALRNIAKELRQRFEQGPGATQGVAAIQDFLPTASNRGFDSAAQRARGYVKRSLGFTGGEGNTVAESTALYDPYLPSSSDYDSSILDKIAALEELANLAEGKSVSVLGGRPDASGNVVPVGQQSPIKQQLATGETRREVDPVASGIIDRMIRQGKSAEEINAVLSPLGFNPVGPGDVAAAQDYLRKNPKYDKSFGRAERILPIENPTLNAALQTAPGTAAATYLNAGGFGVPQALNPQAFEALRDKNPMSAFAGDVGGIITATSGIGAVGNSLARSLAPNALTGGGRLGNAARAIAPDAVYGAGYGAVTEGDPLTGAATAAVGSGAGQLLGKGLQKGFQGVSDPAVQYLTERGIPLSIGETFGNNSIIGRQMQRMESLPLLGDMMSARRGEARDAVYRAALEDSASLAGGQLDAANPLASAQQAVSGAYDNAVGNVTVPFDARFANDFGNAQNMASTLPPDLKGKFDAAMASRVYPLSANRSNLPMPSQLNTPRAPTAEEMRNFSRVEDVPLSAARSGQSQMAWNQQNAGKYSDPLIDGFADRPVAVRLENGEYVIMDGNHRTVRAFNDGQQSIPAYVLNAKAFDPANAGRAAAPEQQSVDELLAALTDAGMAPAATQASARQALPTAITGKQYQQSMRGLSGYKAEATKPGFEQDYRDAISMVQDALKGQMMRNGGESVVTGLNKADQAYSILKPIEQATITARGTPTPKQMLSAFTNNTKKYGGVGAAARGDKVPDVVRYAAENAPNIGNSGTADRLAGIMPFILPTTLGGSAAGLETFTDSPFLTGTLATLAALSTKTGQRATQAALTKRPKAIKRLGGIFGRREAQKGLAGMVTAPLLIED
jgi:hypothetical protein